MQIRSRTDLKIAYEVLKDIQTLTPLPGREEATRKYIERLKRDIREFFRQQEKAEERRIIRDDGIDGFTELVMLPDFLHTVEDATEYFEEKEVQHCPNSIYDCTGIAFTSGYKIFSRRGRMWAYHSISFDV